MPSARRDLPAAALLIALPLAGCPAGDAPPAAPEPPPAPGSAAAGPADAGSAPATGAGPAALVLWHAYRGGEAKALDAVVEDYNRAEAARPPGQAGPPLKALAIPFDALNDKITAAVPRGHGPDLFVFAHNMVGPWAEAGIVEPLGAWAGEAVLGRFLPATVRALVYKADLYGLPLAYKTLALFRNRALAPQAPATLDDLVAAADAARAKGPSAAGAGVYGLVTDATKLYFTAPWLHAFGALVIGDDGLPAFATPEGAAAVAWVRDLMAVRKVIPDETSVHLATTLFNEGRAAFMLSGPWFLAEARAGLDYAVSPLPAHAGRPARPLLGSEAVMVSAKGAAKQAAFAAADFLTSDASAARRWELSRQTVANRAVYAQPGPAADATTQAFLRQLDASVPMSASPRMQAVWSPSDRALHRALKGGVEPLQALTEARDEILRDIERAGR